MKNVSAADTADSDARMSERGRTVIVQLMIAVPV